MVMEARFLKYAGDLWDVQAGSLGYFGDPSGSNPGDPCLV